MCGISGHISLEKHLCRTGSKINFGIDIFRTCFFAEILLMAAFAYSQNEMYDQHKTMAILDLRL